VDTIPHASIGIGIFMAASLHATAALKRVPYHEYQHSIFDKNLCFVTGDMACEAGFYRLPSGLASSREVNPESLDLHSPATLENRSRAKERPTELRCVTYLSPGIS